MISTSKTMLFVGECVRGETFLPADDQSSFAVFSTAERACGVTLCLKEGRVTLYGSPSLIVPPFARDLKKWHAYVWEADVPWAHNVIMDPSDGEVLYVDNRLELEGDLKGRVESVVDLLLSDAFNDFIVAFVEQYRVTDYVDW